jgi:hypothetical protein
MPFQRLDGSAGQFDSPPAPGRLRLHEYQSDSASALECLADRQPAALQIDVLPAQPQGLPDSEPSRAEQHPERVEAVGLRPIKQEQQLIGAQGGSRPSARPRRQDEQRGVLPHQSEVEGMAQGSMEQAMDLKQ